ncbi:hypothetical protein FB451DRAFT_1196249 [Mycena latifolia]|nr:hypothetical protein FB451DRAFT_1196249 [Mycena latifolia]
MSSTPPQATAATPQMEMAALVEQLKSIAEAAAVAQSLLASVLLATLFVPVPSFVAGEPATPNAVAAAFPPDEEVQSYWVVLRGHEPGLYRTTKGVPNQHMQRKTGRDEALAFYAANFPQFVKKWIPVPAPVPVAAAPASADVVTIPAPIDAATTPAAPDAAPDVATPSGMPPGWVDGLTDGDDNTA